MPFIHVRYSTPVEKDLRQPIAAFLTETTARVLRKKPEVTAVAVEQVPASPLVHRRPLPRRSPDRPPSSWRSASPAGRT